MITIANLYYQYPGASKQVLQGVQLSIEQGSLFGLLGPNGAGKTTLIGLLTGILRHSQGSITIAGHPLPHGIKQVKQLIGYIPQDYAFYPNLTGYENLQFFAGVQGIAANRKKARIDYCLEFCQLQQVANQRASEYSGGLKRRLNIAIGLLTDPELLFFDEPTVSIDPQSRAFILQQIKALKDQGKTIIYTSHYMEEVEQLCDVLAIIDHGKLLKQGSLQQLQQEQQSQLIIDCEGLVDDSSIDHIKNSFAVLANGNRLVFPDVPDMATYDQIMTLVQQLHIPINSVFYSKHNLEQVFLDLTSRQLRG